MERRRLVISESNQAVRKKTVLKKKTLLKIQKRKIQKRLCWKSLGYPSVIGIDEVGRGCLAGPVVSCALMLKTSEYDHLFMDSKILVPKRRQELQSLIRENAVYAIGMATVEEIDQINILQATFLSMKRAVQELRIKMCLENALHLIDGPYLLPDFGCLHQRAVIDGDALFAPISAASIVAKVYRDELMASMDKSHPGYHFGVHKGYGTKIHREAISQLGPSAVHRRSFCGVKEHL